jgi:hypothetical protein
MGRNQAKFVIVYKQLQAQSLLTYPLVSNDVISDFITANGLVCDNTPTAELAQRRDQFLETIVRSLVATYKPITKRNYEDED